MLPPLSLLCQPREFGPPMRYDRASPTCVNTHTVLRKCCTSLLYYLDNHSAVGVMAKNTLHLQILNEGPTNTYKHPLL